MLRHADLDGEHLRADPPAALTKAWLRVAVTALAVAAGACGGDTTQPAAGSLELSDFKFRPDAIAVTAGNQVTLKVTNKGKVLHNISIPAIEADIDYAPGQSTNLIFIAPASGPLEFFCKYHRDQGMTGAFIVRK